MWNLKHKTNKQTKQNRNRLIPYFTECKLVVARGGGEVRDLGEIGKGD